VTPSRESPAWQDVIRVWTATDAVSAEVAAEGRGARTWWLLLGLYALSFVFFSILSQRLNTLALHDAVFGTSDTPLTPPQEAFLWSVTAAAIMMLCLLQWLLLPRIARSLGGSGARIDATRFYYLFFAVGFGSLWMNSALEFVSVIVGRFHLLAGGYLSLGGGLLLFVIAMVPATRAARIVQRFPSMRRAVWAIALSLLASLAVLLVIVLGLVFGASVLFPELFEGVS
jgi:glucan phosphoethanolaminetransferase (alkaline phosphatase superfamily)